MRGFHCVNNPITKVPGESSSLHLHHVFYAHLPERSPCLSLLPYHTAINPSTLRINGARLGEHLEDHREGAEITGQVNPVKGGPTAQAQKHVGEQLNSQNISDITKGEKKITGQDQPVKDGPTSAAQSMLS